jgi:hypothetical protein
MQNILYWIDHRQHSKITINNKKKNLELILCYLKDELILDSLKNIKKKLKIEI